MNQSLQDKVAVIVGSSSMGRATALAFASADACLFVACLPTRTRVPELILAPAGL